MHVQSILNAANKAENLPVAVFKYRGKRKFLTKEKEYEETIKLVKEAFKIVQDVSFYTSTLDVCRDQFVEIDSSAYSALRAVLDEIVVVEAGSDPEDATGNRKTKARVSTTVSASSSAFSVARQLQPRGSGAATTSARTIQGPRSSLVRPQPQRTSAVHETVTRKGSTGSLDVKDYQSTSEADEREMVVAEGQDQELEYEDERAADEVNDDAAVEEPEQEEELEQLADEEEEEEDDLFGDAEEPDAEDEGAHTEEQGRRTSDEFDMVPERSYRADFPPEQEAAADFQSPEPAKPPSKSQLAEELFPESPSPPARTKRPAPRGSDLPVKPERTPKVKPEPASSSKRATTVTTGTTTTTSSRSSAKPSKTTATTTSNAVPIDDNARIAIVIQSLPVDGDEDPQSATFKMRGRHMVHKILKTACGNFGLDFENASLFLAQDVFDEDGIFVETEFVHCPNDRTAAQCGIMDGAKLVIQVATDSD